MNPFHSQEDFELIERYHMGLLDPVEEEEIRRKILADKDFASLVREIGDLQLGVERAALASRLEAFHAEIREEKRNMPVRALRPSLFWGVAASLFLAITAGIWWMFGQKSPGEELYQAYFRPDPGLVTAMSGDANYEFDRAMVDYKVGNYADAITRWEKLRSEDPKNDSILYFLGISNLAMGRQAQAERLLGEVVSLPDSEFGAEANWYLGLVFLKKGDHDRAKTYLQKSERPEIPDILERLEKQ